MGKSKLGIADCGQEELQGVVNAMYGVLDTCVRTLNMQGARVIAVMKDGSRRQLGYAPIAMETYLEIERVMITFPEAEPKTVPARPRPTALLS